MNRNKFPYLVFILFGLIFCSISFANHYNFRTFAADLGIETNAIYDYAHLRWNNCMIMQPQFDNMLSDHFSLLTMFFAPLGYLFKSYTLLIVQIFFLLLGGFGSYKLILLKTKNEALSNLSVLHFFVIWGIYSALAFDFHHNVIGTMIAIWFFYYFERREWSKTILCFILVLMSKENMALWMGFICLGIAIQKNQSFNARRNAVLLSLISLAYFVLVLKVVMPGLSNGGRAYLHFDYEALGSTPELAIKKIIQHPLDAFSLLIENQTGNLEWNGFKPEFYFMLLISGGFAIFLRPSYLLMLLPLLGQKMFNSDSSKWGLESHYCIEFVPIIIIAFYEWLNQFDPEKYRRAIAIIFILLAAAGTFNSFQNSYSIRYNRDNYRFYDKHHYYRSFRSSKVYDALKKIPYDARVSATTELVPHLSWRETIYAFPVVNDADYIAMLDDEATYPLTRNEFDDKITSLKNSAEWILLYNENSTLIFKRKASN